MTSRASGAFVYTMLTGHCAVGDEPADQDSGAWRSWLAHRIGYEAADCHALKWPSALSSFMPHHVSNKTISRNEPTLMDVSFLRRVNNITVRLTVERPDLINVEPAELVFTSDNHNAAGNPTDSTGRCRPETLITIVTAESDDPIFDELTDRWIYKATSEQ